MADPTAVSPSPSADLYARLSAPFDTAHRVPIGGGGDAPYLTGEQVVTRLNAVLGPQGWDFQIVGHGLNAEADEYWVDGVLTIRALGGSVQRQQFGSQKVKRAKQSGTPLDIGFDLKGAATDCLKKCATLIGVGLELSAKTPPASTGERAVTEPRQPSFDWTVIWRTLNQRGISPAVVQDRCGATLGEYTKQKGYTTQVALLADPRLQP
jgi:hypothetical protein